MGRGMKIHIDNCQFSISSISLFFLLIDESVN